MTNFAEKLKDALELLEESLGDSPETEQDPTRLVDDAAKLIREVLTEFPQFTHDCDVCTFLGRSENGRADLYFCKQSGDAGPTVIARYSSDGADYLSGLMFAGTQPWLREAAKVAKARNLL